MDPSEIHIKEPKTYEQQIDILNERKLIIDDVEEALSLLKSVNYYRFSAYGLTLVPDPHRLIPVKRWGSGTNFLKVFPADIYTASVKIGTITEGITFDEFEDNDLDSDVVIKNILVIKVVGDWHQSKEYNTTG